MGVLYHLRGLLRRFGLFTKGKPESQPIDLSEFLEWHDVWDELDIESVGSLACQYASGQGELAHNFPIEGCFDFTPDSLKFADKHLEFVRNQILSGKVGSKADVVALILNAGCYLAVTMRKTDPKIEILLYPQLLCAAENDDGLADIMTKSLPFLLTCFRRESEFCFPVNKVIKFIENGPEDSLHSFHNIFANRQFAS